MLTILYQASLDSGILPTIWKAATVAPIFKKGDRNKPSNYRPISLTVICCKLLEHIIHSSMMRHFDSCNILTDFQHGFRKARSCESQLIITVDDIANNLDDGLQTDLILLDFSKAFDKVPHLRLLHKLQHYGVKGSLLTWISNFLQGRVQKVNLDGESSDQSPVSSGVPQGTVHFYSWPTSMTCLIVSLLSPMLDCLLTIVWSTESSITTTMPSNSKKI